MYELLKEFIKPELFILIPVLYLIGTAIKKSEIRDKLIPWLLGGAGVVLCTVYILASSDITDYRDGLLALFTAITQGVLIAGCSVYVNQLVKQAGKIE